MLSMAESKAVSMFQDPWFQYGKSKTMSNHHWVINEEQHESSSTSSFEASTISNISSSSSIDTIDDDASSSSSTSNSNESLYDLSQLMTELPIKRGLSKYYQGKSESFTCLSRVTSVEDLVKKLPASTRKFRSSKSHGGLDTYKSYSLLPKRTISKKGSSVKGGSFSSSSMISSCRPPMIPEQKNMGF